MRTLVCIVALFLAATLSAVCGETASSPTLPVGLEMVNLPRPNSGTFSYEQAEVRKHEILSNQPSKAMTDWVNPFMGFAIHVAADDSLTVYSPTPNMPDIMKYPTGKVTVDEIMDLERRTLQFGNPHGILVTSDRKLSQSKTFVALFKSLFVPGIQIFYLKKPQ
jgi:hypothetical protein